MKKCKSIIFILTLMITLCSCGTSEKNTDTYSKIYEKYKDIKSYQCKIEMTVISNKTSKDYEINQFYLEPDKYRIEIVKPELIKGLTTIYDGENVTTIAPDIKEQFKLSDYSSETDDYVFLPEFFEAYYKSEQTTITVASNDEGKYTILKADIPGSNIYRFSQEVWFDNTTLLPVKLEVRDIKNKPVITARFVQFEMDIKLDDEIFKIRNS